MAAARFWQCLGSMYVLYFVALCAALPFWGDWEGLEDLGKGLHNAELFLGCLCCILAAEFRSAFTVPCR